MSWKETRVSREETLPASWQNELHKSFLKGFYNSSSFRPKSEDGGKRLQKEYADQKGRNGPNNICYLRSFGRLVWPLLERSQDSPHAESVKL